MTNLQSYLYVFYFNRWIISALLIVIVGLAFYEAVERKWGERNRI